jgi:hypothetical protein
MICSVPFELIMLDISLSPKGQAGTSNNLTNPKAADFCSKSWSL